VTAAKLARVVLAERGDYPAFELWQGQRRIEKCWRSEAERTG
jgi:hypothetical protein